jgi:hypothetical protein
MLPPVTITGWAFTCVAHQESCAIPAGHSAEEAGQQNRFDIEGSRSPIPN